MKNLLLLITVVACVLAVACQMPTSLKKPGSLTVTLPAPPGGRAASVGSSYKIQLIQNGVPVGNIYTGTYSTGLTVSISGITPGSGYGLYVATGSPNSGNFLETAYFGSTSQSFSISAGANTAVSVTMGTPPVRIIEDYNVTPHLAASLNQPTAESQLLFTANGYMESSPGTDPTVTSSWVPYYVATYLNPVPSPSPLAVLFPGATINAIQPFGPSVYALLTSTGAYFGAGISFGPVPSPIPSPFPSTGVSNLLVGMVYPSPPTVPIPTPSASVTPNPLNVVYLVTTSGGTEFYTGPESSSATPTPTVTPAVFTVPGGTTGYSDNVDSTFIDPTQNSPGDAPPLSNFVYVVSSGTLYCLPGSVLATVTGSSNLGALLAQNTLGTADGTAVTLVSNITDNGSNAYVFAGTTNGIYASAVSARTGLPAGSLSRVSGTAGLNITALATSNITSTWASTTPFTAYTAAYSATTNEIIILNNTSVLLRYPAVVIGLPSGTPKFTWTVYKSGSSSSTLAVVVSGAEATVMVPVITWPYAPVATPAPTPVT